MLGGAEELGLREHSLLCPLSVGLWAASIPRPNLSNYTDGITG